MKRIVMSHFDEPNMAILALIIFLVCFIGYTFWTFCKKNKPMFEAISMMPLTEDLPLKKSTDQLGRSSHER